MARASKVVALPNPTSFIEYQALKFLITDAPSDLNLPAYLEEFKKYKVTDVVRVCEPTYDQSLLTTAGIKFHDVPFTDGEAPPSEVVTQWLALIKERFVVGPAGVICIHCVAGLGRAPVMVAIALMEYGLDWQAAVDLIRSKRRGAINRIQLVYLETYRPRSTKKCCVIC
eukprot:c39884_g1_i1.p1 GENE.c39884_g1_i1~~c39884_g1_i1.p1  ORF type:complete len:170 (+),score=19.08 c39884_g1_i1:298-807(+)